MFVEGKIYLCTQEGKGWILGRLVHTRALTVRSDMLQLFITSREPLYKTYGVELYLYPLCLDGKPEFKTVKDPEEKVCVVMQHTFEEKDTFPHAWTQVELVGDHEETALSMYRLLGDTPSLEDYRRLGDAL